MERRGEIEIHRAVGVRASASALLFDRKLDAATVKPPAPFSGFGHFSARSGAGERDRGVWTGNLSVDLPGHADLPITGAGFWPLCSTRVADRVVTLALNHFSEPE